MPPQSSSPADAARAKQDADREALQRLMAMITDEAGQMRTASPADAERMHARLKERCTDKRLPGDFKKRILDQARAFERDANMRAADRELALAVALAASENMPLRALKLNEGRKFFAKACSLGADEEFRRATQRLIDTIMMTGGVYKPGAHTKAKPLDTAPKNPRNAKV
jgi:hypothetical protein